MKMRCPLDVYVYISQTFDQHVESARRQGLCAYPGAGCKGYYYGGIDYAVSVGAAVKAAADGTVILVNKGSAGYGYEVRIDHGEGLVSIYGHNSVINVVKGQAVKQGDIISHSGNTGNSTGPHLHFEVRLNGSPVDPQIYIDASIEPEVSMNVKVLAEGLAIRSQPERTGITLKRVKAGTMLDAKCIDTIWLQLKDGSYVAARFKGEDLIDISNLK